MLGRPERGGNVDDPTSGTRSTSCCGNRRSKTNRLGSRCGAPAGRDGTSNARPWRCASWAPPSASTVGSRPDLPHHWCERGQSRPPPASPSSATGCTRRWCGWTREDVEVARQSRVRVGSAQAMGQAPSSHDTRREPLPTPGELGLSPDTCAGPNGSNGGEPQGWAMVDSMRCAPLSTMTSTHQRPIAAVDRAAAAGQRVSKAADLLGIELG